MSARQTLARRLLDAQQHRAWGLNALLREAAEALETVPPEAARITIAPDMLEFASGIVNVDKMARDGTGGYPANCSELLMARYLLKLACAPSPLARSQEKS